MANDFQSQFNCPYCNNTGIETIFKGDPSLEEDVLCDCGIMSPEEWHARTESIMKNWGKDATAFLDDLKKQGIDIVKSVKSIDNELRR